MYVFKPISINDSNLVSTIPEPDVAVGEVEWSAGSYSKGDRVIKISTHLLYESAIDSNTDDPEVGILEVPPTWVEVSSTNKYRMFDDVSGTQSVSSSPLIVTIESSDLVTSLAGFNIGQSVDTINISVTVPIYGEVYNKNVELRDSSKITDWYQYFFEPIVNSSEFLVNDLPNYRNSEIKITFIGTDPAVGVIKIGRQIELGVAEYGSSLSLKDWSTREVDQFGNFKIKRRGTSKNVDFDGFIPTNQAQYVFDRLSELSTIPAVWYGSGLQSDSTLAFGYYSDSTINISNPSTTDISITIEGLV